MMEVEANAPASPALIRLAQRLGLRYLGHAGRLLLWEVRLWCVHAISCVRARRYREASGLKLHLGCGPKIKAGWLNVDAGPHADLRLDLRRPLPLADGSCSTVYSEHFLEHVDYPDDALALLRECHRVLERGGRLSIGVPDGEMCMGWYQSALAQGQERLPPPTEGGHVPAWCDTPMERINFFFRLNQPYWFHDHRFAYDYVTLSKALALAGFAQIQRRPFDTGLDSEDRRYATMHVEAVKPRE